VMNAATGTYEQVSLGAIVPSTTNPRKSFDDASMADLTASVREAGVQSPILLRKMFDSDGDSLPTLEIVCGERRYRAAKAAGLETIPAIVRELDDETAYQAQIIENLQREDLGPMEEAESYAVLVKTGTAPLDLAAKVGKSGAYVAQRMQLLKLVPRGKKALSEAKLMLGHAIEISKLKPDQQAKALEHSMPSWGSPPSLPQLKQFIQREFRLELGKAPFSIKDAALHPEAGACVDCAKRTGADSLLFSDVKEGDSCLDAKCYQAKVKTVIHIRVEELKKTQKSVPLLTDSWQADKSKPAGTIGRQGYELATRPCDSSLFGLMLDGNRVGQKVRICTEKKCVTHHGGGNRFGGPGTAADQAKRKAEAAKQRRDTEVRMRTATAIVAAILGSKLLDDDVNIDDAIDVADYAFNRMDHANDGRLATALGWDKKAMGYRSKDRRDMLSGMGIRKALSFAVLATVAGDMSATHTWGDTKATALNGVAARHGVNVKAIETAIDAEIKAKAKPKAKPVKKPVAKKGIKAKPAKLAPEARKRIAAAMKKRWTATRKKAG
jgi:ParB family transcriptional regulator, chromosome partitioning protein